MANTEKNRASRTKSKNKYNEKTYDRFMVVVPKGEMQEIGKAAKEQGYKSRNEFVVAAINEKREKKYMRDTEKELIQKEE